MKVTFASIARRTFPIASALVIAAVAVIGLWAWHRMPIYPDEVALKIARARYIQDHGVAYRLYGAMCSDAVRATPLLFAPAAWLLSWLGLAFTPEWMRMIPAAIVIASVALVLLDTLSERRISNAFFVLAAFAGVAGSGLIMARHEIAVELNLLVCFGVVVVLERENLSSVTRWALACLLAYSGVFSVSVHLQGLLFIPLTSLLVYRLLGPTAPRWFSLLTALIYAGLVIHTTFVFQGQSCARYPEVEKFWNDMTYKSQYGSESILRYLASGYRDYVHRFLYVGEYDMGYLPAVVAESASQQRWLNALNGLVAIVVSINAIMLVIVSLRGVYVFMAGLARRRGNSALETIERCVAPREIALAAVAAPIVFLFVYDPLHNFYRAFFLNFAASIAIALSIPSSLAHRRRRILPAAVASVAAICAIGSIFANVDWFAKAFEGTSAKPGYEGPSISVNRDPARLERDVLALEAACHIDPKRGSAVVDDMTYEPLKRVPMVLPVTYVYLVAMLSRRTTADVLKDAHASFVLARCASMNSAHLPYSHQQGELCCADLSGE